MNDAATPSPPPAGEGLPELMQSLKTAIGNYANWCLTQRMIINPTKELKREFAKLEAALSQAARRESEDTRDAERKPATKEQPE